MNPPTLEDGDALLVDAPGRCGGLDAHSHHFRLVRNGSLVFPKLLVRHGGGEERFRISLPNVDALLALDPDAQYWILHAIYYAHSDADREAAQRTSDRYIRAFASGKLRKRKVRGCDAVKVWIEEPAVGSEAVR
jgi:hypothetical protein